MDQISSSGQQLLLPKGQKERGTPANSSLSPGEKFMASGLVLLFLYKEAVSQTTGTFTKDGSYLFLSSFCHILSELMMN